MYLDNAATTPVLPVVDELYQRYAHAAFYNPSALYAPSVAVAREVKGARSRLAQLLGCKPEQLIFTSGGTEADNLALYGARKRKGSRIIISNIEHDAVYRTAMALRQQGYEVVLAPVDSYGRVIAEEFYSLITPDTSLVSIIHVSNETGAVNDIATLCARAKQINPHLLFHADGVQAFCHVPVNVRSLGVDFYSVSAHKLGALKGTGALYVREGVHISPLLTGGGQESDRRSGTENVLGIAAFAACAELCSREMNALAEKGLALRKALQPLLSDRCLLISPEDGAPHICTLSFSDVRGEVLMHALEASGIQVGIGSACSSNKGTARAPEALGLTGGFTKGMLRLSINHFDTYDFEFLSQAIQEQVKILSRFIRI